MPILTLQKQARELGRIRIGQKTANGAPTKLDRFRLTTASRDLLDQVAAAYGGTVAAWTPPGGAAQWEVVTDAARLPVLVPPQPVTQWFELWSGGGCKRRCDGNREMLTDSPCACGPDPEQRDCKPTTRLNVILRDIPGLGVWRLESHGYYAAVELPEVASFLAATAGYVSASLILEQRVVKRDGQPIRKFAVPALEVENVTPAQLMAGEGSTTLAIGGTATRELTAGEPAGDLRAYLDSAEAVPDLPALTALVKAAQADGLARDLADTSDPLARAFLQARERVTKPTAPVTADDPDALWFQIIQAAPDGWTTQQVEAHFAEITGVTAAAATAAHMRTYLAAGATA